jgi:hypothetical protein
MVTARLNEEMVIRPPPDVFIWIFYLALPLPRRRWATSTVAGSIQFIWPKSGAANSTKNVQN